MPKPIAWRVSWPFGGAQHGHVVEIQMPWSPRRGIPGTGPVLIMKRRQDLLSMLSRVASTDSHGGTGDIL